MRNNFKNSKGFTLIELLVVVGILALIGGFAIPRYIGVLNQAKTDVSGSDVKLIQAAVDRYTLDQEKGTKTTAQIWEALTGSASGTTPALKALTTTNNPLETSGYLKKGTSSLSSFSVDASLVVSKP